MVAVLLGVMALAGYAGAAGLPDRLAASEEPIARTAPSNPALAMALATDGISAGSIPIVVEGRPTPLISAKWLLSQSEPGPQAYAVTIGVSPETARTNFGAWAASPLASEVRPIEVSLFAKTGLDLDVKVAHHNVAQDGPQGSVTGRGAEVRVGRGLSDRLGLDYRSGDSKAWYLFAGSEGKAVTWTPATDPASPTSSVHLQRQVEVGDLQAGVGMEINGVQASLAYVKRDVKTQIGPWKKSFDDSFAGLTLSWRR